MKSALQQLFESLWLDATATSTTCLSAFLDGHTFVVHSSGSSENNSVLSDGQP